MSRPLSYQKRNRIIVLKISLYGGNHYEKSALDYPMLFILFLTNLVYAQPGHSSIASFYGEFKPVVGGWAEYQITAKSQKPGKAGTRYHEDACFRKPERSEKHKKDDRQTGK